MVLSTHINIILESDIPDVSVIGRWITHVSTHVRNTYIIPDIPGTAIANIKCTQFDSAAILMNNECLELLDYRIGISNFTMGYAQCNRIYAIPVRDGLRIDIVPTDPTGTAKLSYDLYHISEPRKHDDQVSTRMWGYVVMCIMAFAVIIIKY